MNSIEFISDAYTEDGLKLPMVHFVVREKRCICYLYSWHVWNNNR